LQGLFFLRRWLSECFDAVESGRYLWTRAPKWRNW
jgi:hypothetical protein